MPIGLVPPSKVNRRLDDVFVWKQLVFQECHGSCRASGGEVRVWPLPDPAVASGSIPALLQAMGVTSVLATIIAPERVVFVPYDEKTKVMGEPVELDPRLDQVWYRQELMEKNMPPAHYAAVTDLFHEAGVRRGFRGGIVAEAEDCLRVAGLLAVYAVDVCSDVLLMCEGMSLAIKACHEADVHVYSREDTVLASCTSVMRGLGLRPYVGVGGS